MSNLFEKADTTVLNRYVGYYYVRNEDSTTHLGYNNSTLLLEQFYGGEALVHLSELTDENTQRIAANQYANLIYIALSCMIRNNEKATFKEKYDYVCQHINAVLRLKGVEIKYRFMLNSYKLSPKLYWSILRPILLRKHKSGKI